MNAANFEVPNIGMKDPQRERLERRIDLRKQFDQLQRDVDQLGNMQAFDTFEQQTWNLLTSEKTRAAFDLTRESDAARDRYGRNSWGQQCLMARRLVEAGVDIVTTQFAGRLCGRVGNWDDHAVNHHVFKAMEYRAPVFDQAIAALVEDIYDRGLDERVMLVVTGEFGRTPKISYVASSGEGTASAAAGIVQPGRDHWPSATSLLFAGGGIETGRVIGATDSRGEQVVQRLVSVQDFLATIYHHLEIPAASMSIQDFSGRPIPILADGKPIPELVAV